MFIVPIVISIGLVYFYKKEVVLVETALIVFPSFLIIGICYAISYYSLTNSIEYLGDYAVKITHYDDWDEWVHQTCTRSVPCGVDSKGLPIGMQLIGKKFSEKTLFNVADVYDSSREEK